MVEMDGDVLAVKTIREVFREVQAGRLHPPEMERSIDKCDGRRMERLFCRLLHGSRPQLY